jgi:hypothetical protein
VEKLSSFFSQMKKKKTLLFLAEANQNLAKAKSVNPPYNFSQSKGLVI